MQRVRMAAVLAVCVGMSSLLLAEADSSNAKTQQGEVHGKTIAEGKVKAFLGLPYAAPPVGELRWRAPEAPVKWKGVRDATSFRSHCAQLPVAVGPAFIFSDPGPSEDCLYLNVYAPAKADAKSRLPVMFWIHGGAYTGGAGSEARYSGEFMAQRGVVVVTINYRVGVLGFLAASELAKEAGGVAGNYALMDMVAALRWVNANIREFGGDPGNVTIFGESAGSFAVSTMMAVPIARDLFQKAIGESGSALPGNGATRSLNDAMKDGDEWIAKAGAKSIADLRSWDVNKVLAAAKGKSWGLAISVDGKATVEPLESTYAAGRQAHVPLLAGWNRDEFSFQSREMTAEKWKPMAAQLFKDRAEAFLKLYPAETDEQAASSADAFGGDQFIAFATWKWIELQRMAAPVYRYHFELPAPASQFLPGGAAFHSDELEYVFGTLDTRPGAAWRPEDRMLSEQMVSYWTNFAKNGDPNGPGLPTWPKYDKKDSLIHLDSTITSGPDTLRPRYEFLKGGLPPFRMPM
jgi:para-nitrobenzyl esterase